MEGLHNFSCNFVPSVTENDTESMYLRTKNNIMSIENNTSEKLGFGMLTPHRCIVYDSKYLSNVIDGTLKIEDITPTLVLNYADEDAIPFEGLSIELPGNKNHSMFEIGEKGTSHQQLIEPFLKDVHYFSPLMKRGWRNDPKQAKIIDTMSFTLVGRLWEKSKVVIIKSDEADFKETILTIYDNLLYSNYPVDIDISSYTLLQLRGNENIEGENCGDIVAYSIKEFLDEQTEAMKTWSEQQWLEYRRRDTYYDVEDVFGPILRMILEEDEEDE